MAEQYGREVGMRKPLKALISTLLLGFWLSVASAAIEVNQASSDDLESIKGIGPSTAQRILQQRRTAPFRDWKDLIVRVPGIGEKRAAQLSDQGLRVQGQTFKPSTTSRTSAPPPIGYAPRSSASQAAQAHPR